MSALSGYDHGTEEEAGYEDGRAGRPRRLGQTAPYRHGYDRGLTYHAARTTLDAMSDEAVRYQMVHGAPGGTHRAAIMDEARVRGIA